MDFYQNSYMSIYYIYSTMTPQWIYTNLNLKSQDCFFCLKEELYSDNIDGVQCCVKHVDGISSICCSGIDSPIWGIRDAVNYSSENGTPHQSYSRFIDFGGYLLSMGIVQFSKYN